MATPDTVTRLPATPGARRAVGKAAGRSGKGIGTNSGGPWFVLPFLLVYVAFAIWPILYGLGMSFFDVSLVGGSSDFVGLENYREMVGDDLVWTTLWHTVLFTILSTVPLVLIALIMALLVHTGVRGQWFWRFVYFAPFLLPVATVVLIWNWLFQNDFGLINGLLDKVGLPTIGWLNDAGVALTSTVVLTVWWTVGFNFLLYLAALQAIPQQLYEAADLDGATGWRQLLSITLPLLKTTTVLVIVLQVLASLKVFDQIYILFSGSGGPEAAATPLLQYVYDTGFVNYRLGYAAAISYMFFALIVVVSLGQAWFTSRRERTS